MAGICIHEGFRCWPCMNGNCHDYPTYHVWYDEEEEKAYAESNMPLPTGANSECGCYFCGRPAIARLKIEGSNQQGT